MSNTQSKYFYSSAKTENGMSGGPIARTSDNKIVGIVKGRLDEDINKTRSEERRVGKECRL